MPDETDFSREFRIYSRKIRAVWRQRARMNHFQTGSKGGNIMLEYGKAFLCGGLLCVIGQLLIDKTSLTPAKILVSYVTAGVILGGVGLYQPLADWAGAGATVPLTGFGNLLAKGVREAVAERGFLGALTGGATAAAGGITAAIFFGFLVALLFKSKPKS